MLRYRRFHSGWTLHPECHYGDPEHVTSVESSWSIMKRPRLWLFPSFYRLCSIPYTTPMRNMNLPHSRVEFTDCWHSFRKSIQPRFFPTAGRYTSPLCLNWRQGVIVVVGKNEINWLFYGYKSLVRGSPSPPSYRPPRRFWSDASIGFVGKKVFPSRVHIRPQLSEATECEIDTRWVHTHDRFYW